ncbi:hypothetical protein ACFX16_024860 [Malus domestica]
MILDVGKNLSKNALVMLSQDVTVPGANSYNQSLAFSISENEKAFICNMLPSTLTGVMLEQTISNSFNACLDLPLTAHGNLECDATNWTST